MNNTSCSTTQLYGHQGSTEIYYFQMSLISSSGLWFQVLSLLWRLILLFSKEKSKAGIYDKYLIINTITGETWRYARPFLLLSFLTLKSFAV